MDAQPVKNPPNDELLRLIFESATDFAIFTMDPNGIVTSWNRGAERLLGYADEEIFGQSADVIFLTEERQNAPADERRTALARGRAEDERWQQRKDGTPFWASGLLMPLTDRSQGFVKILRDRSEHHRIEQQLRQNEESFRLLATNIPQLVFRSRGTGDRTWGSPQWSIYTGLTVADSLEFRWLDAIHPDDRERTVAGWRQAGTSGEYNVQHRIRRVASEVYRWHQTRAQPIDPDDLANSEWVGASTDIHELRVLQDKQNVLLAELHHRTRNLLAIVQAIARQSIHSAPTKEQFYHDLSGRLRSLGVAQRLLSGAEHTGTDLRELIELELSAHGQITDGPSNKITLHGPAAELTPETVQTLALALHELTTNALKHGALAQAPAHLSISWQLVNDEHILLLWRESNVVMPPSPTRRGYGRQLIEEALAYQLGAQTRLDFTDDGVLCELIIPATGRD
ncbi:sensor histidine kinase [Steroidobacter flavus]|uniref:histidine kinase n=1 Tax=Steroidobacter flavus TaxID=1842136 RepID=A0ABV8T4V2_9GAMM